MFNSISQQLNNYNSEQQRYSQLQATVRNKHYFPLASQFSQFVPKPLTAEPKEGPYHYYQPKSKIGQLNQRIE